jgi:hypothetical protein
MLENNVRIIKHKVGLLNLAEKLGWVTSPASKSWTIGCTRSAPLSLTEVIIDLAFGE